MSAYCSRPTVLAAICLELQPLGLLEGLNDIPPCEDSPSPRPRPASRSISSSLPRSTNAAAALTEMPIVSIGRTTSPFRPSFARGRADCGGLAPLAWRPDLVHANDWPAALACGYSRLAQCARAKPLHDTQSRAPRVFAGGRVHALGIPISAYAMYGVNSRQALLPKAGLISPQHVTTVSPTYAREILREDMGCGLHHLLASLAASGRLSGITNGIGEVGRHRSPHLVQTYRRTRAKKQRTADLVRAEFGLAQDRRPLFAVASRLVHQKGIDLVLHAAAAIVAKGGQLAPLARATATRSGGDAERRLSTRAVSG